MATGEGSGKDGEAFDVVLACGEAADGEGASVLRARPGRLEAGVIRPVRDGQPLAAGGEVVRLAPRPEAPFVYDVESSYSVPGPGPRPSSSASATQPSKGDAESRPRTLSGPAQVATDAYRASWERTFGRRRPPSLPN
jgi:hypothetical protein